MKTEELSRHDLMKWGGAAVASIPLETLESIMSGRGEASKNLPTTEEKERSTAGNREGVGTRGRERS